MGRVYAILPASTNPVLAVRALPRSVEGMSWVFPWKSIQPTATTYAWGAVDACLDAADQSGRTSMLRITAGEKSPAWAPRMTSRALGKQRPRDRRN